jgi:hypothetical protein
LATIKTGLRARFFSPIATIAGKLMGFTKRELLKQQRLRALSGASYSGLLFLLIAVK